MSDTLLCGDIPSAYLTPDSFLTWMVADVRRLVARYCVFRLGDTPLPASFPVTVSAGHEWGDPTLKLVSRVDPIILKCYHGTQDRAVVGLCMYDVGDWMPFCSGEIGASGTLLDDIDIWYEFGLTRNDILNLCALVDRRQTGEDGCDWCDWFAALYARQLVLAGFFAVECRHVHT